MATGTGPLRALSTALTVAAVVGLTAPVAPADERNAKIEATHFVVGGGRYGDATATCPGAKRALGGGVVQSGGIYGPEVAASGPLDASGEVLETDTGDIATQWYTSVANPGFTSPRNMGVFAICAKEQDAVIEATLATAAPHGVTEAYAVCPRSSRALGGGVVQVGSPFLRVGASGPLDASGITLETKDGDVAKQWYAAVANSTDDDQLFKVFAICAASSRARIEATGFTVNTGRNAEAYARCKGSERALGGGVVQSGPPNYLVHASGPLDESGVTLQTDDGDIATQWYSVVSNYSGRNNRVFKVFAICV